MGHRPFMSSLFATIVCVAVAISFLSGAVSWTGDLRGVSHAGCTSDVHGAGLVADNPTPPPFSLADVPAYAGDPSVAINGGLPFFTDEDRAQDSFELYSALDARGRCGTAFALIGPETLPAAQREGIGMVRPSGWKIARYPWVDGEYLFNRCHLIAYMLAGENANERNLITGTRSLNVNGMLPYEEAVSSYVHRTGNHVLYRVTPLFDGRNLVASGVLIEAESVEDSGAGVTFCAWCYNVEPGVTINYANGESRADGTIEAPAASLDEAGGAGATEWPETFGIRDEHVSSENGAAEGGSAAPLVDPDAPFVVNISSHRLHRPDCPSVAEMSASNRQAFYGTREEAIEAGYEPCGWCKP